MEHFNPTVILVPLSPLLAAAGLSVMREGNRRFATCLATGSLAVSFLLALVLFVGTLLPGGHGTVSVYNFNWIPIGDAWLRLGILLDPLSSIMILMVTFVSLMIFIYSAGYMAGDPRYTRFFCFLSFFAAAMLGLVLANSLLLLFVCWELVGLASYLLIGFWYTKPAAAAAARKAFMVTRIADLGLFIGIIALSGASGTLLFYDAGNGCLEEAVRARLAAQTLAGFPAITVIGLLIFCGAMGKSGQVPLHVWLPDAMEGPTPVSALIHAATMVAAGVFLVARMYPLLADPAAGGASSVVLVAITWIGALTAVFAALIAVAQNDIKRILAYSTVSQLGYMFVGLGAGGVAVGMFHLLTHAFFKALLFLGAGSVIHALAGEQNILRMGGLRRWLPVTFATYALGMMALSGVPLLAGFWSKDEILHAAGNWFASGPFILCLLGAVLTAFYMTRQMCFVFFRGERSDQPHESPPVMTVPLLALACFAVGAGFLGTPAWPWVQGYLEGRAVSFHPGALAEAHVLTTMLLSVLAAGLGLVLGWIAYGRRAAAANDPLVTRAPAIMGVLQHEGYVNDFYQATVVRSQHRGARMADWLDTGLWDGCVRAGSWLVLGFAWVARFFDTFAIDGGFDRVCERVRRGGGWVGLLHRGQPHEYLRVLALASVALLLLFIWGWR